MNLSDRKVLIIDHGLFLSLASRLAREFGEVFYAPIWSQGFPTYHVSDVGKELPGITHTDDAWRIIDAHADKKDELLIAFPDILDSGWQLHLRSLGYRVWGSGWGDELEIYRVFFKETLEKVGLPVNPYEVVHGAAALREYLREHDDVFVKFTQKLRGIMETFESKQYWLIEPRLDQLIHLLGMKKREVAFTVEKKIKTKIEVGGDMYCIDGQYPKTVSNGIEIKDQCSASVVQAFKDLPDEVRKVCDKMAPVLKGYGYRNFFSTEIRVGEDGKPYFIDPTCRHPSPVGESEQELWSNLGEIMWRGAEGVMVDPLPAAKYAVQAMIYSDRADEEWQPIDFPEKIRDRVKLYYHRRLEGHDYIMPQTTKLNECGSVVGLGDTLKEAKDDCANLAKQVIGDKVCIHLESIEEAEGEFAEMAKKGMNIEPSEG
jgi:phosphoribosylamine-glycine ligase